MNRRNKVDGVRRRGLAVLAAVVVAVAAGCQPEAVAPRPATSTTIDPCADRMHDLVGRMLLYLQLYQQWPPALKDLQTVDPAPMPPLVCPASGKPYVYNPGGIEIPGRQGRVILYDESPTHAGMRWCVLAESAGPGAPLTARVIRVPDLPVFSAREAPAARFPAMEPPAQR